MLYHPRFAVDEVGVLVKELLVVGNDLASLVDFEVLLDFLWLTLQVVLLRDFLQPLSQVQVRHLKHSDHPFEFLEFLLQFQHMMRNFFLDFFCQVHNICL